MDGQTHRILYAKNADLKLKPASTTKLVTAMVVLDKLNPDSVVIVSKDAAYTPSIAPRLRPGDRVTVRDLLYLALMRSINGAAVALSEAVSGSQSSFALLMNEKVASLNAKNTKFVNATGLPAPGQYITASNLAIILDSALKYPLIKQIINTREKDLYIGKRHLYLRNTDKLLWADDDLIGGKTGYTRAAEHCLVFAASKGNCTIVTSLLGEQIRDHLWSDGQKLLNQSVQVANGTAQPEIYETKNPVVLTSYEPVRHGRHLSRRRRLLRHRLLRRRLLSRRLLKRKLLSQRHSRAKRLRERRLARLRARILRHRRRVLRARRYSHKRKYVRA